MHTTSLVRKSAPMVALYCEEKVLETNWVISLVLPRFYVKNDFTLGSTNASIAEQDNFEQDFSLGHSLTLEPEAEIRFQSIMIFVNCCDEAETLINCRCQGVRPPIHVVLRTS